MCTFLGVFLTPCLFFSFFQTSSPLAFLPFCIPLPCSSMFHQRVFGLDFERNHWCVSNLYIDEKQTALGSIVSMGNSWGREFLPAGWSITNMASGHFLFSLFFLLLQFYGFASRGPFEARFVYPPFLLLFLSFFYDVMRGEKKGLFLFFIRFCFRLPFFCFRFLCE